MTIETAEKAEDRINKELDRCIEAVNKFHEEFKHLTDSLERLNYKIEQFKTHL